MVRAPAVLDGIRRGIEDSGRMPSDTTYYTRMIDESGMDAGGTLPDVLISEVSTIEDDDRSTQVVGYIRDDDNHIIGRIFESGFEMEVQIDVNVPVGDDPNIGELRKRVQLALRQYDSAFRGDLFPDGDGGGIGDIRDFSVGQTRPADELTTTPSLRRQRMSASVLFVDRLDEVDEYGALETIKEVRTPRDGDYEGVSDDYHLEHNP